MLRFSDLSKSSRRWLFIALGLLALGAVLWSTRHSWRKPDPLVITPTLALESLQAKTLYFNSVARPWLIAQRIDLLKPEDADPDSERTREFTQAVQVPKLFRQLDRKYRFDALLLTGDPSQYRPLLDHLVETKDWKLTYIDHTSYVFRRDETKAWELADFTKVRAHFAKKPDFQQATVLAQTATKLIAIRRQEPAYQLLKDAEKLSSRNPDVANGLAIYHLERGEWKEASKQVERALSLDKEFIPALATKTQLLYGAKYFSEAFEISKQLIARLPEDPGLLFYHAKIAHEAHAYKAEIETLEKLIAWADAEGRPVAGYQLYLGQAYATIGDGRRSIDSFMLALNDPDLPADQRAFARDNILRIKKRTGL
jgi:tetratricopeptide (TPR) repeat protein